MTPVAALLHDEIARTGPISFHRFMDVALYHSEHGYYRQARDPFGKSGDYYTAEQLQPVFGTLIASYVRTLTGELGNPEDVVVLEPGPGRQEMAEFFAGFRYVPLGLDDQLPERFTGVIFANEFFDALPVHVAIKRGDGFNSLLVTSDDEGRFRWIEGSRVTVELNSYLNRFAAGVEEGTVVEANLDALAWIAKFSERLDRGYLLAIDYGYTMREVLRFPAGTLMSYRRHIASEDVLADPGTRDITAHVPFTALQHHAFACGFESARIESLTQLLMRTGERDQFESALAAATEAERVQRRLQLKTLLFSMGESFRVLLCGKESQKEVGPK